MSMYFCFVRLGDLGNVVTLPNHNFNVIDSRSNINPLELVKHSVLTILIMTNVIIDPSMVIGAIGGEEINLVINQTESVELLKLLPGFIQLDVDINRSQNYSKNLCSSSVKLMRSIIQTGQFQLDSSNIYEEKTVLMVTRVDYVNLYQTLADWYNTFLTLHLLNLEPSEVHVLLIDGHPRGGLDHVWYRLFGNSVSRIGAYRTEAHTRNDLIKILPADNKGILRIRKAITIPCGYSSPLLLKERYNPTLMEEFRSFVLDSFNINHKQNVCTYSNKKPHVLIIWRRDYVAHPRNVKGLILRKITNEAELVWALQNSNLVGNITAIQLDLLPMSEQLELVASADILIGMHGAGLSHIMFLPRTSCVLELYPSYCCGGNYHLANLAKWRNLCYDKYVNAPAYDTLPDKSYIPPQKFVEKVSRLTHIWTSERLNFLKQCTRL